MSNLDDAILTLFDSDGDNTAQAVKTRRGRLMFISVSNINAADIFVQLFDAAAADVTVGTTVPKLSIHVEAGDATDAKATHIEWPQGIGFNTAITYSCTTTATGNGDPSVGAVCNFGYL